MSRSLNLICCSDKIIKLFERLNKLSEQHNLVERTTSLLFLAIFVNTYLETKLLVPLRVAVVATFQYMQKII